MIRLIEIGLRNPKKFLSRSGFLLVGIGVIIFLLFALKMLG
jgi:hypothetical protein